MAAVRLGKKKFHLPGSSTVRRVMGVGLVAGGVLGFLPVLGFWMVPLGVAILSVDNAPLRKVRRKAEVWWGRRRSKRGS